MDILLIGGASNVMDAVINKLNKEGHRIYILTGSKYKVGKYKPVYEKYYFEYDSDSVKEVLDSIKPDVTIFTGAYDSNFKWYQEGKESVRFSAGLINTLIGFSLLGRGKFIYLSSDEVYGSSYSEDIPEEEMTSAISYRAMALVQAEAVCMNYRQTMGLDIVIVRVDHLTLIPSKKAEVKDVCSRMCLEAIRSGRIIANANITVSMLYLSDTVEFIYKLIRASSHKRIIYHISSGEVINEMQLAALIKNEMTKDVSIIDNTIGEVHRVVLSGSQFDEEFGLTIRHPKEEIVHEIVDYMEHHLGSFIEEEDIGRGFFGRLFQKLKQTVQVLIPFLENVICFIPFFMINNRAVGSEYFANIDIYLIYVLLFAIIYGQQQATFSAIFAVAGYCFRQMYHRSGFEVLTDYNTYVWIGHLFVLGLVVGYMRDRLNAIKGERELEISYLSDQLTDIQDINTSNVRMKNILETKIINQNDSIGKIYDVISGLDQYEPEEVLFHAVEVLSRLMDSKDVAIYTIAGNPYARIVSATSPKARELGNSIKYMEYEDMYEELKQRHVFINKKLIEKYPLMANAIYSEDKMQLILMVWGLPWERMTLSQSNMLVVIGYLIQNAVVRANRYMEALENKRYLEGTNILDKEAFQSLLRAYVSAGKKGLTICCVLRVEVSDKDYEKAGEVLSNMLRKTDYLGKLEDEKLYALLSNTSKTDSELVIKRFHEAGYQSEICEDDKLWTEKN